MNLYNISLKSLIMRNINCDQLPHTIQKDVNQLLEFKTKLKRALRMKEQIDKITVCIDDNTYELDTPDLRKQKTMVHVVQNCGACGPSYWSDRGRAKYDEIPWSMVQ